MEHIGRLGHEIAAMLDTCRDGGQRRPASVRFLR